MLLMLLDRLLRRQVHRRTRQLRSLGRLQELLWRRMLRVRARLVLLTSAVSADAAKAAHKLLTSIR